jgi:hypothetical protein
MRYLKLFEEFVETPRNTEVLYQDDNLVVKVAKTFDAVKHLNKNTSWCSTSPAGFYSHNRTANMYRIDFKAGYKLRLTWDYIPQKASELGQFSGGTHWGQGGIVNGEKMWYDVFRPRDEENPFEIDWQSEKKRDIVERILSIPDEAKLAMMEYQEKLTKKKSENLIKLYKEIEQVKVVDVKRAEKDSSWYDQVFDIAISYRGKKYQIELNHNDKDKYFFEFGNFAKDFKNRYFQYGREMSKYLYDKTMEYIKNHDLDII